MFASAFGVQALGATLQLCLSVLAFLLGILPSLFFGTTFASSANKNRNTADALEFITKSLYPATSGEVPRSSPATVPLPSMPAAAAAIPAAAPTTESLVAAPAP